MERVRKVCEDPTEGAPLVGVSLDKDPVDDRGIFVPVFRYCRAFEDAVPEGVLNCLT